MLLSHKEFLLQNSHNHYFVALTELLKNLPEDASDQFPTADHLRKWCLIKAGFHDEVSTVCATHAEAVRWARSLRKIDDYAVVVANDKVVTYYTAKSQSFNAMSKGEFQRSKQAVLDELAKMLDVTPTELVDNADKAA